MKWKSRPEIKLLVKKFAHFIPNDFDPIIYILLHPDLIAAGIDDEQKAKEHYLLFGRRENRQYKKIKVISEVQKNIYTPEIWNNGKNLLYFSPMAPDYDCSSGGNRLLQILKILKNLDYNIWFMCNGYNSQQHIEAVKSLGIKVFLPDIKNNQYLDQYLKEAVDSDITFHNAIFSWYDIGHQYIDIVQSYYPNIKIIVDSVDVHWVREQRGKDSGELNIPQDSLDMRKNIEKNIYNKANVIFAITEQDKKHIQKEIGYGANIKILSNIHDEQNIKLGNNIVFIGNYNHSPNVDAVKESIKVYRLFQTSITYKKLKQKPKLLIIGPFLDSEIITSIKNDPNIRYLGQIKNISDIYPESILLIAPLFWGAGIKGKICDAGMSGIPILTSDIGNEGINFIDQNHALIANTTEAFVSKLEYFFNLSYKKKIELGQAGKNHLTKIVSTQAAQNILEHTLQTKKVIISIVTYNQNIKLKKCLDTILEKTKYPDYHIIISDNGSNYKCEQLIKNYNSSKITYIKNKENNYFIIPNNNIIQNPSYMDADILLVNDDIEIIDGYWLNYLYSSAYSADYIAAAGGKTVYPNGMLAEAGAELYDDGTGRNKGRYQSPSSPVYNIPHYTGYCSGCLLYLRRDAINKIGILSTELEKMYYEDSEWQYRAHIYGLKTIYDHRCEAIHDEGSSSGTDITKGTKKYQAINQNKFLKIMKDLGCDTVSIYNE